MMTWPRVPNHAASIWSDIARAYTEADARGEARRLNFFGPPLSVLLLSSSLPLERNLKKYGERLALSQSLLSLHLSFRSSRTFRVEMVFQMNGMCRRRYYS